MRPFLYTRPNRIGRYAAFCGMRNEEGLSLVDYPAEYRKNIEEIFPICYEAGSSRKETTGFRPWRFIIVKERFSSNYIYVEGHTDNQSLAVFEWKSDWDFSFARALSVVKYFTEKKHMDPLRLSASGFGQYRPRQSNETKEGRRLNRRIEIVISSHRARQIRRSF